MAAETNTATETQTAPKATRKRKPVVKRKPVTRKATARKTARKGTPDFAARAQEAGRNAFLAGLGFYGKAFDQAQEQFNSIQEQLEDRRKKADKLYQELVKRGEKVEKDARGAIKGIELDSLTDRKKLEKQLAKAKARFEELKDNVSFRKAA